MNTEADVDWLGEFIESTREIEVLSRNLADKVESQLNPQAFGDLKQISLVAGSILKILQNNKLLSNEKGISDVRRTLRDLLLNIIGPCHSIEEDSANGNFKSQLLQIQRNTNQCFALLSLSSDKKNGSSPLTNEPKAHPANVLIVDPSRPNRELLMRFLFHEGHEAVSVPKSRDAIRELEKSMFEIVILTADVDDSSQMSVLSWLRDTGRLSLTPVIILSDNFNEANAVKAINAGAESFLSSPPNADLLLARVRSCLEKNRLRLQQLEVYFSPKLARHLLWHPELVSEGRSEEITVLFCDVQSFSGISETLKPKDTMAWLTGVLEVLSDCVSRYEGVIVDYVGDELIAIWGAPQFDPDHAENAVRAAREMIIRLEEFDKKWAKSVRHTTKVTIGINTGQAFLGNVGTSRKFKYGCLGNTVNLSSRTQGANKYLATNILMTKFTQSRLPGALKSRRIIKARVTNIKEPVELYELPGKEPKDWDYLSSHYEDALQDFENQRFHRASSILGDLLFRFPNDGPSLNLISQVVDALQGSDKVFDPVWSLPGK